DAMIHGLMRVIAQGDHLGIYHIGSEEEITIERLAKEIGNHCGRQVEVVPGPLQLGGTLRRCPDISKLRARGYQPRISLQEGLASTVKWYDDNASRFEETTRSFVTDQV